MKLFYFTEDNLKNDLFIKEFASAYHKVQGKAILVHAPFGTLHDTRFVTKRISSLLSEVMIVNNPVSGDQKRMVTISETGQIQIRAAELDRQLTMVNLLVMNPIAQSPEGPVVIDSIALTAEIRKTFQASPLTLFTRNSKSPLSQEIIKVEGETDVQSFLNIYDEESAALNGAVALAPSVISSPNHLG